MVTLVTSQKIEGLKYAVTKAWNLTRQAISKMILTAMTIFTDVHVKGRVALSFGMCQEIPQVLSDPKNEGIAIIRNVG